MNEGNTNSKTARAVIVGFGPSVSVVHGPREIIEEPEVMAAFRQNIISQEVAPPKIPVYGPGYRPTTPDGKCGGSGINL
jgi:hypothetical protein